MLRAWMKGVDAGASMIFSDCSDLQGPGTYEIATKCYKLCIDTDARICFACAIVRRRLKRKAM